MARHEIHFKKTNVTTDEVLEDRIEKFRSIYNAERRMAELQNIVDDNKAVEIKYELKLHELPNTVRHIARLPEAA